MINSFSVKNYRRLKDIRLNHLGKINVFVGSNNSGKTSIIEALALHNISNILTILYSRHNTPSINMIKSLITNNDISEKIRISTNYGEGNLININIRYTTENIIEKSESDILSDRNHNLSEKLTLFYDFYEEKDGQKNEGTRSIAFTDNGRNVKVSNVTGTGNFTEIPCSFVSDVSNVFRLVDAVLNNNMRNELIRVLQIFDQEITNIEIVDSGRNIIVFRNNESKPLFLSDYGNGMYKAFYISVNALLCQSGILLIDEIETGIHHKALVKFIDFLMKLCIDKNIQLFLTTHSLETIDAILENKIIACTDVMAYRMRNVYGKISPKAYSGGKLYELRKDAGFDLR